MEGEGKHVSRYPKYPGWRSVRRIPSGDANFLGGGRGGRGSWRMPRFFNNPHPSPLPKVFHGIRPFEKLDEWLFESLKASIDLAPLTF